MKRKCTFRVESALHRPEEEFLRDLGLQNRNKQRGGFPVIIVRRFRTHSDDGASSSELRRLRGKPSAIISGSPELSDFRPKLVFDGLSDLIEGMLFWVY